MKKSKNSKLLFVSIFLLIFSSCSVKQKLQETESTLNDESYFIEGKNLSDIQIDNIGNVFLVKNHRILRKYNSEGSLDKTFDYQNAGFIHSVDAINPLYILIFYKESSTIILLDRNLAQLKEIDISKWSNNDITAAVLSNDNNIWLYDNTERKLKKYSRDGNLLFESLDIYGMTNLNTNVSQILEFGNQVFMRNELGRLIVMTNLGQYKEDKAIEVGLAMTPRRNQLCCPTNNVYSCIKMDGNPFEQTIPISTLHEEHKEAFLFKFELYQIINGGVIKTPIIRN